MVYVPASITSLNPTTGPSSGGTTVVLTGQYFTGITGVQFGSLKAPSFTINSDTQITTVSPAQSGGNVSVGVIEYTGDVCGAATFTYGFDYAISTTLTQVSVGSQTNIWGVDAAHHIYKYLGSGTNWTQISGALKQVSVASDGTVWGVDANGSVYHYTGTIWVLIAGNLAQVAVGSASLIWGVNQYSQIFQYTGTTWTQIPGALKQVSVASDGSVWGVDANGSVYHYNGNKTWTQIPGTAPFAQVAVASAGLVNGLDLSGNVYEYNPYLSNQANPWALISVPAKSLSYAADLSLVIIDLQGITLLYPPPAG